MPAHEKSARPSPREPHLSDPLDELNRLPTVEEALARALAEEEAAYGHLRVRPWGWRWFLLRALLVCLVLGLVGGIVLAYTVYTLQKDLPPLDSLIDYRPKLPLRIYTADNVLIGEFGEERRQVVTLDQTPKILKDAVIAIEDARFYEHGGVDYYGIARSAITSALAGHITGGASTITQQVARGFFLTSERSLRRKLTEILLAYRIEGAMSKDQILERYMNNIFLGQQAYGFASAAKVYFGKDLKSITLAEAAMLAGLPKGPSNNNPITNPKRARTRQVYILRQMQKLGYIDESVMQAAIDQPIVLARNSSAPLVSNAAQRTTLHAEYLAEMVRQVMADKYKDNVYTNGYTVVTTVRAKDQQAAHQAVRDAVMDYDRRYAYRGPEHIYELSRDDEQRTQQIEDIFSQHPDNEELRAALVTGITPEKVTVQLRDGNTILLDKSAVGYARDAIWGKSETRSVQVPIGSVIRVAQRMQDGGKAGKQPVWQVVQVPQVEGSFVSIDPANGAILALVGGFDFAKNKYNRVTQAYRQPGSTFKPFIYSAALERGIGTTTLVNDRMLNLPPSSDPEEERWDPRDDDTPEGPMTLRNALRKSKNLVSVRLLRYIGIDYAQQFVLRFGFTQKNVPPYLSMALGAGQVTPLQLASAYAVFANGGYRVTPYFISKILDAQNKVLEQATPQTVGNDAPSVIDPRNAYIINSLLTTVAQRGTAAATNELKRGDLAGKTGTTNNARDAWFAGYQRTRVGVAWMGFDQSQSLGSREYGARLSLPIWVNYMKLVLADKPIAIMPMPDKITMVGTEPYYAENTPDSPDFIKGIDLDEEGTPSGDMLEASLPAIDSDPEKL